MPLVLVVMATLVMPLILELLEPLPPLLVH